MKNTILRELERVMEQRGKVTKAQRDYAMVEEQFAAEMFQMTCLPDVHLLLHRTPENIIDKSDS